jgi:hypothetical protein
MELRALLVAAVVVACACAAPPASAHPLADLEVGDPLEDELRSLELLDPAGRGRAVLLAHLNTRPVLRDGWAPDSGLVPNALAAISWRRLARALERDRAMAPAAPTPGATPYLAKLEDDQGARFDLSARLEGRLDADRDTTRFADLSGLHVRAALGFDRWILQTHWVVGQVDSARRFADPLVAGHDVLAQPVQALVGYVAPGDRWGARFGRGRWHWGPGEEGSLVLSKTSAPLTALEFHASLARARLTLTALSATLETVSGRQLAAHRVEWQPLDDLRLGATDAAIYHASGWSPLYLIGLLPYTSSQRLETQDEPAEAATFRNNVMVSADAAWRIAPGSRVYGELLVDDLHARTSDNPDKIAYQLGWDGMGGALGTRLRWNGEYTRLSRYVYTSFFGSEASAQGRPLGFPTGPDARRLRLSLACDPSLDWELSAIAARTEKGENDLGEPYVPGTPRPDVWSLSGVVERTREIEGVMRWWPSGGVDLALRVGYEWRENAGHVAGVDRNGARGALEVRVGR